MQGMPDVSAIDRGGGKGRGQSAGLTGNEAGCRGRHTTTERGLIEAQSRTGHPAGPSAADAERLEGGEHFAVDLPAVRQRVGSPAQVASSALTQPSAFPSITRFEDGNWSGFASLVNRSTSALSPLATTGRGLRRNSACAFGKSAKLENAAFSWALGPCRCRRACRAATPSGKPSTRAARGKAATAYFAFPSTSATSFWNSSRWRAELQAERAALAAQQQALAARRRRLHRAMQAGRLR